MNKKYELTNKMVLNGRTLYRIRALRGFGNVGKGYLGGWIEKEDNLSHLGNCWVYDNAKVCDDALVRDNALVYGEAIICGRAEVKELSDYIVLKNNWSSGRYYTYTRSNKMWTVGCFHGTGEELIKKAYEDSEESGRKYEASVRYVESLYGE